MKTIENLKIKEREDGPVKYKIIGKGKYPYTYKVLAKTRICTVKFQCLDIEWNDDFEIVKVRLREIFREHLEHVNYTICENYQTKND